MQWSKKYPCKEIRHDHTALRCCRAVVWGGKDYTCAGSLSRFSFHIATRNSLLPQDGMLIHGWFITGSLPPTQNFAVPIWPLTDMTDQDWISPYNISQTDDENKGDYELILYQIVWIEQQTVRWITDEILRMKGLNSWVEKGNVFNPRT